MHEKGFFFLGILRVIIKAKLLKAHVTLFLTKLYVIDTMGGLGIFEWLLGG